MRDVSVSVSTSVSMHLELDLNFNLTYFPASFRRKVRGGPSVTYPPSYAPGKEVTVQAVRACPWPSCIIVGCDMEKLSR